MANKIVSTTTVKNVATNNTTSKQENSVMDETKHQELVKLITAIRNDHDELKKGEQEADNAASKIGKNLWRIEKEELFKQDEKDGKEISSMAEFIKKNFEFSYQYGVMLKQSARVQETLKLNNTVSFRLLRPLNRYADKPEALKAIWQSTDNDSKDKSIKKRLEDAIRKWEKEHPEDAYQFGKKQSKQEDDLDTILKDDKSTLKQIGSALANMDPSTISDELGTALIEKIKAVLQKRIEAAA